MQKRLLTWIGGGVATLAIGGAFLWGSDHTYAATGNAAPAAQAATATPTTTPKLNRKGERRKVAVKRSLIHITASLTKQTPEQVRQALQDGKSLAQFAAAHGSSGDAVVSAAIDKAKARLDKAVHNGRITQPQADQRLAALRDKLNTAVNRIRSK